MSQQVEVIDDWEDLDSPEEDFLDILLTPTLPSENPLECKLDEVEEYQIVDWPSYEEHDPRSRKSRSVSPINVRRAESGDFRRRPLPPLPPLPRQTGEVVPNRGRGGRTVSAPRAKCYAPTCGIDGYQNACYSYACRQSTPTRPDRSKDLRPDMLGRPFRERFVKKIISNERKYAELLEFVDSDIVKPLYFVKPPMLSSSCLNELMKVAFGNMIAMSRCHRSHLDALSDRCYSFGDVFLEHILTLRPIYLDFSAKFPAAMRMLRSQRKANPAFSLFSFLVGERLILRAQNQGSPRDIDSLLQVPIRHLQRFEVMMSDLLLVTPDSHPDVPHLTKAIEIARDMLSVSATSTL